MPFVGGQTHPKARGAKLDNLVLGGHLWKLASQKGV